MPNTLSPTPSRPLCPVCDKPLRVTENVYKYGGPEEKYAKRKVGERPARNAYAPFCSLRCGWSYGKAIIDQQRKKK